MVQVVGKDTGAIKRCTCKNCGSILDYTQNEVESRGGKDYGGYNWYEEYIRCPTCQSHVVVYSL
jgi:ribosomal protein S27E